MAETYMDNGIVRIKIYTARCNRCDCRFEYLPGLVHSTKSECVPRCPKCGSYRETVVCQETR